MHGTRGKADAELHSGTAAFEGLATAGWLADYFRIVQLLLRALGKSLVDLFGTEEAAGAEKMILAAAEKVIGDVKKAISGAAKIFSERDPATQAGLRKSGEIEAKANQGFEGQDVKCPACGSRAVVKGERVAVKEPRIDDVTGTMYRQRVILPNALNCFVCGLSLKGHASLHAAELGGNYSILEHLDPADYFGIETPDLDAYFESRMKELAEEAEYSNE